MRKHEIILTVIAILFSMSGVYSAHAKSSENKANCQAWCNSNKPKCSFCNANITCKGRDHNVIKSFKKGTGNWHACGLSQHAIKSSENERKCKQWCANTSECNQCTSGNCGRGIKHLKTFGGRGENWYACQKTNWTKNTEKSKAEAEKWCADYRQSTREDCRIVKSGKSCPAGFYKSDRLKVRWGKDYKVCLVRKSDSQRVKDCPAKAVVNIEQALDWINTHYGTIVDEFRMQPRDYRDRRAHDRYDRKFPNVTITCEDHKNKCKKHPKRGGWSTAGRKIHLCYSNIDKFSDFCGLVGIIIHEGAHNAWVDDELSQHVGDPGDKDDTVYQLGNRAEDLCRKK